MKEILRSYARETREKTRKKKINNSLAVNKIKFYDQKLGFTK
jgi:hypothetical protein